jgi:hypothetical protein
MFEFRSSLVCVRKGEFNALVVLQQYFARLSSKEKEKSSKLLQKAWWYSKVVWKALGAD